MNKAIAGKGKGSGRGGRRPGAGRPRGTGHPNGSYIERQRLAGVMLGFDDPEHCERIRRMFIEDPALVQSPAFRFLAAYFFGKVPDPEIERGSGKGLMVAFLKGALGEYDPLAHRMPKALQQATVIEDRPTVVEPDPNHPEIVDIPEPP